MFNDMDSGVLGAEIVIVTVGHQQCYGGREG